jgi:hypothetical protein
MGRAGGWIATSGLVTLPLPASVVIGGPRPDAS